MASRKRKKRVAAPAVDPKWIKLLAEHSEGTNPPEVVPPGWLTMTDLAEVWALSVSHATNKARGLVKAGLIERRMFRIMRNTVRPVPHYQIIKA